MLDSSLLQSSTARVKTGQLWTKNKHDLKKQLDDLKSELGQLRVQKISGGAASKLTRMFVVKSTPYICAHQVLIYLV